MTVGNPPGIGRRAAASAAEEGRSVFVDLVLNEFVESAHISVPDEVRAYILGKVLVPDEEWESGRLAGELDAQRAAGVLLDALRLVSRRRKRFPADMGEVDNLFHQAIEGRCWFPFWFC